MGVLILPIHDLPLQLGFNQLTGLLPAAWSSSNVRPPVELPLIGELGWAIEVSKPKPVLSLNARYREIYTLVLSNNSLTGPAFPPAWLELGAMAGLRELQLKDAAGLTGTLPSNLS